MRHLYPLSCFTMLLGLVIALFLGGATPGQAADWFVAPLGKPASLAANGSMDAPFASVTAAIESGMVKGGDRILLQDGEYGYLTLRNAIFDRTVTIMSLNGRNAHFDGIFLRDNGRFIRLENLSVWPNDPSTVPSWPPGLVSTMGSVTDVVVRNLDVRSEKNAADFESWDAARWEARKYDGIRLDGARSRAASNQVTGLYNGIVLTGNDSQAVGNVVNGFNGDALRGLGDNNVFRYNRVYNCVKTDENHDDGFQSWAGPSGSIKGLVLDGNSIIEWTGAPGHPLRCQLEGIGLFDGFYDDITITNNLTLTTQYHGITVCGMRNGTIVNNTVINQDGTSLTSPYIFVCDHKNGTPSSGVLVANNLATRFLGEASVQNRVVFRNNSVVSDRAAVFVNPAAFDYRPKRDSGFIDSADPTVAPVRDVLRQTRPGGILPDRGAYEVQSGTATAIPIPDSGTTTVTDTTTTTGGADTGGAKWLKLP